MSITMSIHAYNSLYLHFVFKNIFQLRNTEGNARWWHHRKCICTSFFCFISFLLWYLHWCETVWTLSNFKCGKQNVGFFFLELRWVFPILCFNDYIFPLSWTVFVLFRPKFFRKFWLKSRDCTKLIVFSICLWIVWKVWLIKMPYSPLLWFLYLVKIN